MFLTLMFAVAVIGIAAYLLFRNNGDNTGNPGAMGTGGNIAPKDQRQ